MSSQTTILIGILAELLPPFASENATVGMKSYCTDEQQALSPGNRSIQRQKAKVVCMKQTILPSGAVFDFRKSN